MNFTMIPVLLATGFAVSFLVLDLSRIAAPRHWPVAHAALGENFRPFAVFLALFCGPALFAQALFRMFGAGGVRVGDCAVGIFIACSWAFCYGLVVLRLARFAGLPVP